MMMIIIIIFITVNCVKTADSIEGKEPCIMWGPDSSRASGILGGISLPIVKYRKYPACGRDSQPYWVGGSMDAVTTAVACYDTVYRLFFTVFTRATLC